MIFSDKENRAEGWMSAGQGGGETGFWVESKPDVTSATEEGAAVW